MIFFNQDTDATLIYRESTGSQVMKMDRTGDTGSLLDVMRDAVICIGAPGISSDRMRERVPEHPWGNVDAYTSA
ncbi:hypothetical protein [Mesorhizobium sp.]|uniref:hypothetical protein n=1 Tax=Mesorhizobium sp. TaxID=1871066 RepID=UPI00121B3621|nr:hypothetical protein [Mesorhizobium sp.]TIT04407.1 MAG: hypothetical protein E5W87_00025 [Mesorhizobium sp.]